MKKWTGQSRGTILGYRIFVFCIKVLGIRTAYLVLWFVAAYYVLSLPQSNRAICYYFKKRLGFSYLKSKISVFKNYYTFGQTIIDKTAISVGLRNRFTYEFDGIENLKSLLREKKGGVLISAHIGNFEIAEKFLEEIDFNFQINLVTTDQERNVIKEYLQSIAKRQSTIKFIMIKEDLSHIFEINRALSANELICFTGDRYFEGSKSMEENLLGKPAKFPAGPFILASRLNVPVAFVYVMKEANLHYHLYARIAQVKARKPEVLLQSYTQNLEKMINKYPLQWFNYFDFWDDLD